MTDQEFNEKVEESIKNCEWRRDLGGIDVCGGNIGVCEVIIQNGRCEAMKKLIRKIREGKE